MTSVSIEAPRPNDAAAWFDFIVEQQTRTYAGIVRPDFADAQGEFRDEWVPELAESFAVPGSARRLVARWGDSIVGVAATEDAPAKWELELDISLQCY